MSTSNGSRTRSGPRRVPGGSLRRSSACAPASRSADGARREPSPRRSRRSELPEVELDDDAFGPLVDFFVEAGLDGILALGTAGEGSSSRSASGARRRSVPAGRRPPPAGRRPVRSADDGRDRRARRTRGRGRRGRRRRHRPALLSRSTSAPSTRTSSQRRWRARHCRSTSTSSSRRAVTPSSRPCSSGFARTRPNLVGLKVSDTPFERFSRYLLPDLDIFVGPEALIHDGLAARSRRRRLRARLRVSARRRRRRSRSELGGSRASRRAARVRRALSPPGRAQAPARPSGRSGCERTCGRRFAGSPARSATSSTRGTMPYLSAWTRLADRVVGSPRRRRTPPRRPDSRRSDPARMPDLLGSSSPNATTPNRSLASFQIHALGGSSSASVSRSSSIVVFESERLQIRRRTSTRPTCGRCRRSSPAPVRSQRPRARARVPDACRVDR